MKAFLDKNFLLQSDTASQLYHNHAAQLPIIDYHCHLNPQQIADDYRFADLTEIWLGGDHYKWRAMRANGISEDYITGNRPPYEKFLRWAGTMPYAMRNPLYHWTHLELSRVFGIDKVLNMSTAREIYDECTAKLQTADFSARRIMERMNVEVVCTTDDPADSLSHHDEIRKSGFAVKVLPTWRPDKAMAAGSPDYNAYLDRLAEAANIDIATFDNLLEALHIRHEYFKARGCCVSDHGMDMFHELSDSPQRIRDNFNKIRASKTSASIADAIQIHAALLHEGGKMDAKAGWVQQFHVGVTRNNNTAMLKSLGVDAGFDSIDDASFCRGMNSFLDRLNSEGCLAKTILYNLNPKDNAMMVSTAYNFNDGSVPGKIQYGSGWWFLDQKNGMEDQMNILSALGLLSRFVGMLTDSRSFLSYPRHEYFRRILCNLLGRDVENGELPASELPFIGEMVEDISYYNAKKFFGW